MNITASRFAAATLVAFANAEPASACFETDTTVRPWVWFTSTTTAYVAIEGLVVKSGGLGITDFCGVGLGHSNTLFTGVTDLDVLDDADPAGGPLAIPEFAFSANGTTTTDFTTAAPSQTWQGFHSAVGGTVAQGTYVALRFEVQFPASTTYQDILEELQGSDIVGFDDANAIGDLAGIPEQEPIVGSGELPYCYDDIHQMPEEICDGASNMGCPVGDSCVECSVCVTGNPANRCKSEILKSIANVERSQLKCWAAGARAGLAADTNCINDVITAALLWTKYVPSCPQTLPADPVVQGWIDSMGTDLQPIIALGDDSPTGEWKCAQQKFKAASFRAVGNAKCYSKAYRLNTTVDPLCLTKVDMKYQDKIARAELPGVCDPVNVGNTTAIANRADQFVSDILLNIPPP